MELDPCWKAASYAAAQELPNILRNPMLHCCVHKTHPLVSILTQINAVHNIPCYLLRSILILFTHARLGLPSGPFPSDLPTNILHAFLFSQCVLHAPPSHPSWLYLPSGPFPSDLPTNYIPCPSHPPRLYQSNYTWWRAHVMQLLIMQL
jgi:hypothetical protein